MQINPVHENQASDEVKKCYESLKTALGVHSLPLFFTYIGSFPEYLTYISDQLVQNLHDERFNTLINESALQFEELIQNSLPSSADKKEWLAKYSASPTFYYFKEDISHIFKTNVKLCLIFIALREAVKGWAVAAKQLQSGGTSAESISMAVSTIQESIIYEGIIQPSINNHETRLNQAHTNNEVSSPDTTIVISAPNTIEKNLLPEYLRICRSDFDSQMKREQFLMARVAIERMLLGYIGLLPHLIFSPINVVLDLTSKYRTFPELLYLLSEHFPTYAVQRLMFSGYMRE